MDTATLFDKQYFETTTCRPYRRDAEWLAYFKQRAERIVETLHPHTVLDVGCGMGMEVEALRDLGVCAYGIDVSEYAISQVREDMRAYCSVHSVLEQLPRAPEAYPYDLVLCIEVLEHLPLRKVWEAVHNLCWVAEDVLFSSTPFDFTEATHFNVQPPEYWAELFATQDFYRDHDYDATFITDWALLFRRHTALRAPQLVRDYERAHWQLWQENRALRRAILAKHIGLPNRATTQDCPYYANESESTPR